MEPIKFLDVADRLKNSFEESDRRSAVSRAYYAVYHSIRYYLKSKITDIPDDILRDHRAVIQCLFEGGKNANLPKVVILARLIIELKNDRHEADYDLLSTRFDITQSKNFYDRCKKAIDDFNSYNDPQLISGIEKYLCLINRIHRT
jgi:uncharacterized protein (UPF0332 family)